jgi:hypothetical protein
VPTEFSNWRDEQWACATPAFSSISRTTWWISTSKARTL